MEERKHIYIENLRSELGLTDSANNYYNWISRSHHSTTGLEGSHFYSAKLSFPWIIFHPESMVVDKWKTGDI